MAFGIGNNFTGGPGMAPRALPARPMASQGNALRQIPNSASYKSHEGAGDMAREQMAAARTSMLGRPTMAPGTSSDIGMGIGRFMQGLQAQPAQRSMQPSTLGRADGNLAGAMSGMREMAAPMPRGPGVPQDLSRAPMGRDLGAMDPMPRGGRLMGDDMPGRPLGPRMGGGGGPRPGPRFAAGRNPLAARAGAARGLRRGR